MPKSKSKVYVTMDNGVHDLSTAERYGELVRVFDTPIRPKMASPERMANMVAAASRTLKDFNPETDYLCLVGDVAVIALIAYVLSDLVAGEPIRMLSFDKHAQGYFEIPVVLPNLALTA